MAQVAIKQSTLDRTVRPARRALRYKATASSKTPRTSGDSTIGKANIASRATRKARSSRNPCRTSWTTGRQVTISSSSTFDCRSMRLGLAKTSIHTDVSTRNTSFPALARPFVSSHLRETSFPQAGAGELEDPPRLGPSHEVSESQPYCLRVGSLSAQAKGFLEQIFV